MKQSSQNHCNIHVIWFYIDFLLLQIIAIPTNFSFCSLIMNKNIYSQCDNSWYSVSLVIYYHSTPYRLLFNTHEVEQFATASASGLCTVDRVVCVLSMAFDQSIPNTWHHKYIALLMAHLNSSTYRTTCVCVCVCARWNSPIWWVKTQELNRDWIFTINFYKYFFLLFEFTFTQI